MPDLERTINRMKRLEETIGDKTNWGSGQVIRDAIALLEEYRKIPKWIPVSEDPPEAGVIIWDGYTDPHEARLMGDMTVNEDDGNEAKIYFDGEELTEYLSGEAEEMPRPITHWMAMPEPPKNEEEKI